MRALSKELYTINRTATRDLQTFLDNTYGAAPAIMPSKWPSQVQDFQQQGDAQNPGLVFAEGQFTLDNIGAKHAEMMQSLRHAIGRDGQLNMTAKKMSIEEIERVQVILALYTFQVKAFFRDQINLILSSITSNTIDAHKVRGAIITGLTKILDAELKALLAVHNQLEAERKIKYAKRLVEVPAAHTERTALRTAEVRAPGPQKVYSENSGVMDALNGLTQIMFGGPNNGSFLDYYMWNSGFNAGYAGNNANNFSYIFSDSYRQGYWQGEFDQAFFNQFCPYVGHEVADGVRAVFNLAGDAAHVVGRDVMTLGRGLTNAVDFAGNGLVHVAQALGHVARAVGHVAEGVGRGAEHLVTIGADDLARAGHAISQGASTVGSSFSNGLSDAASAASSAGRSAAEAGSRAIGAIGDVAGDAMHAVGSCCECMGHGCGSCLTAVGDGCGSVFSAVGSGMGDVCSCIGSCAGECCSAVGNAGEDGIKAIGAVIGGILGLIAKLFGVQSPDAGSDNHSNNNSTSTATSMYTQVMNAADDAQQNNNLLHGGGLYVWAALMTVFAGMTVRNTALAVKDIHKGYKREIVPLAAMWVTAIATSAIGFNERETVHGHQLGGKHTAITMGLSFGLAAFYVSRLVMNTKAKAVYGSKVPERDFAKAEVVGGLDGYQLMYGEVMAIMQRVADKVEHQDGRSSFGGCLRATLWHNHSETYKALDAAREMIKGLDFTAALTQLDSITTDYGIGTELAELRYKVGELKAYQQRQYVAVVVETPGCC